MIVLTFSNANAESNADGTLESFTLLRISYHPLVSLKILIIKRRMLFIFGEKSLILS